MTADKQPSTFWLKAIIGILLVSIGFILGLWVRSSCQKKDEGSLVYERSLNGEVVNIWIKGINGIAQKIEYIQVKPDTEYVLDTVYFPRDTVSHYAITRVVLLPNPLESFIRSRDTLGYARETQFLTSPNILNGAYDISIDSTGKVKWYEAPINLEPKEPQTILAVCFSGGAQYGQVDTLWRVRPEFEASLKWRIIKDNLYAKTGFKYPLAYFINLTGEFPLITK